MFGQWGWSLIEDQRTHDVNRSAMCSVSKTGARWRINMLTYCQNYLQSVLSARLELHRWLTLTNYQTGQQGLSLTEDQLTHKLSTDQARAINRRTDCEPPLNMNERNLYYYNLTIACEKLKSCTHIVYDVAIVEFSKYARWDCLSRVKTPRKWSQWISVFISRHRTGSRSSLSTTYLMHAFKLVRWVETNNYY
jgi:hypothetical protein